ncbi:MAG TPA: glucuronate isomerase, partial [Aggregatilineaceae bacterium]|nr:glucuronate isomerase [Aggregatilineaceae bacterium]
MQGKASADDARRFSGHMLIEMARMSAEDGLVMQLHPGSWRDHNPLIAERFGRDEGADIPVTTEHTRSLLPLLREFGNDPRLTLILFTLDETTYARELAPLAGHYQQSSWDRPGGFMTVGTACSGFFGSGDGSFWPLQHGWFQRRYARLSVYAGGYSHQLCGGNREHATTSPERTFFDLPVEALKWALDLNLLGTLLPSQVFGRQMAQYDQEVILD